jgi:hypothetical protein
MIFSRKSLRLVPLYLLYIAAILCTIWAARSLFQEQLTTQIFADKVYCYLIVPPFVLGISLLDESIKKPCIIRMKSRLHSLFYLLFQQYLLAAWYLITWFVLISLFAHGANEQIFVIDLFSKYIRYLLSLFVFANLADLLKRLNIKTLSTIPYIAAYILLLLDIQAITAITNRYGRPLKLIFSWTFYRSIVGYIMLLIFLILTFAALIYRNRKYDIF